MKIRSFIFLIVIVLGLFPLFIMVALNWPKTIERLEYAAESETQAQSHVEFAQLNARIRCLKKSLIRSATLPSAFAAIHDSTNIDTMSGVLKRWFESDEQVQELTLFSGNGDELLSFHREGPELLAGASVVNHFEHRFFRQSLELDENQVFVNLVGQKTDPFQHTGSDEYELLMSTPVVETGRGPIGVMMMRIDMSEFLKNFKDSYWVTENGSYLRGCDASVPAPDSVRDMESDTCNAFTEFPGLQVTEISDPLILSGKNKKKIAWMPLIFNEEHQAVMWVGSRVDESAIEKWKMSLTINVVMIICIMSLLVFISATWIAGKLEFIQKDLLTGLDNIINNEKRTEFKWNGPQEIKNLALDLTALSESYSDTCEARTLAETSLRESEDKFRSLTASALDGIILMDHQGNIAYWNEAATTIFGFTSDEAMGKPIHALLEPRRQGGNLSVEPLGKAKSGRNVAHTVELIVRNKNTNDVFVELSLSSTRIKGQWHAIWIVRDITERKSNEEAARTQQQHLLHADKMISLGLLVSGVAHEINNPNSIALLNLPILTRSWESVKPILDEFYEENGDFSVAGIDYSKMRQQLPRTCTELEESAGRIKQIVVDLKDYARQETSGLMSPVNIAEVVQSGVRLTSSSIHKATNKFVTRYGADLPQVLGNKQRLTQVVINLIQNSCEALAASDLSLTITTRYNRESDGVEISIRDEGAGIAADDLKQVTDPFFTTKRSMGGTGLGLSVSAGIVKEHNGVMNFYSELGKGTEVVIILPALLQTPTH
ncbi:MAG: PAS domain S-box protein [Proteobacteria bacterium]|nr:PAS domain S-box protein [Pseudomonadota bacterium]MBU1417019.1 PAS domain S-box protein [Pseudomonadota bacterium]MBU1453715.1 PAS domain S-box protein [Pseudomonadota bacterium]